MTAKAFYIATRIYDCETWVQISDSLDPKATLCWPTREEAQKWLDTKFPDGKRFDRFHGLQPLRVVEGPPPETFEGGIVR